MLSLEILECIHTESFRKYLGLWNIVDMICILTCLFLWFCIVCQTERISIEAARVIAAVACCALMFKFGDWLRLFDNTGFFVELFYQTLWDIWPFIILMLIAFSTFGIPLMMLALNDDSVESNDFWLDVWPQVFIQQFLISLG